MKKKRKSIYTCSESAVYSVSVSKTKFLLTPNSGHIREIQVCWCMWEALCFVFFPPFKKKSNTEIPQVMQNNVIK